MTHRVVKLDQLQVEVFDTELGARSWVKRNPADCIVVVRGKSYFMRRDGAEITVQLNATDCPENRHVLAAANAIADEVEAAIISGKAA